MTRVGELDPELIPIITMVGSQFGYWVLLGRDPE